MRSPGWMLRALGALGIVLGTLFACREQVGRERRCIRQLCGLCDALEAMERELRERTSAMEVLLREARRVGGEETGWFFGKINLNELELKNFSDQWKELARNTTLQLNETERRLLERPGTVLGRCGVEEQCTCLASAARSLRERARLREAALGERRRVWYTVGLSVALLAVVTLL